MKKISIYSMLAVAGLALASCNDDYKDWNDPQSYEPVDDVTLSFEATNVSAINMTTLGDDIKEVKIFNPTITCNKECTTTYEATIFNIDRTDSVTINVAAEGVASRAEIQGAFVALYGTDEVQREALMNVDAFVIIDGTAVKKSVKGLQLVVTPRYQKLPDVWYITGNCIGDGTMTYSVRFGTGRYTSYVAMYVNPYNYDELIYATYFPAGTEFRIHPDPANKDRYIGGGDEKGNHVYQAERPASEPVKNTVIQNDGFYKVIVNVADPNNPTMRIEALSGDFAVYSAMATTGVTANMKAITTAEKTKKHNHDWLIEDFNIAADGQVVGFMGTYEQGSTTWGGKTFPAGKASAGAAGLPTMAGNYIVVFNDLLGVYRFIEK